MRLHFFTMPVHAGEAEAEALNRHLAQNKVVAVDRHFVSEGANSYWAICVTSIARNQETPTLKRGNIDYREKLSPPEFALFAELRTLRKELAEREGIPAYSIFTNEQLAALIEQRTSSANEMSKIAGIGASRVEKYGGEFLRRLVPAFAGWHAPMDAGHAEA
jgi:superfamily II DNA helicase RecQ